MGIYIKGMEMPKEIDPSITIEFVTGLSGKLYARYHDYNSGGSTEWHEVMTIPEPHGRLIDADAIILKDGPYEYDEWCEWALRQYQDAPTIIAAEE